MPDTWEATDRDVAEVYRQMIPPLIPKKEDQDEVALNLLRKQSIAIHYRRIDLNIAELKDWPGEDK